MNVRKQFNVVVVLSSLIGSLAFAQAVQVPPDVDAQAKTLEAKFNAVLEQECGRSLCTPAGCEVTAFRTLDEKQNASLPGLDVSDETEGPLQYKLSSLRCEFAHEPTLSNEAINALRQRIAEKVRVAGVSLNIQARKLTAAYSDSVKSQAPEANLTSWQSVLAGSFLILALTIAALALIWSVRRLGKPAPIVEENEASSPTATTDVNAFAILEKKERLQAALINPGLAAVALQPLIGKGDVTEICRVLKHFGPAPLVSFVDKPENRDLFSEVHKKYEEAAPEENNSELWNFFEKIERLVSLAQLGRPEIGVREELDFLSELEPDEFTELVGDLSHDELMAVLSFVPLRLRAHYLQLCDEGQVEAYAQHILKYPRISEQSMRRLAQGLKEKFSASRTSIKKVSRDQMQQLEQLLNTLSGARRSQLLNRVRKETPALLSRISSEVLLDGALMNAPEDILNELFLELSPDEAAAYLQSLPDRQKILGKLKGSLGQSITNRIKLRGESLDFLEAESSAVQQTRQRVNEIMRIKSSRGEINLRMMNEPVLQSL